MQTPAATTFTPSAPDAARPSDGVGDAAVGRDSTHDGAPSRCELLTDFGRPRELTDAVHIARRSLGDAPVTIDEMIAAWCVLLARSCGADALVIGECAEHDDRGFVHEITIDPNLSFVALVDAVAATRDAAASAGPIDFGTLAASFGIVASPDRHPLFAASVGPVGEAVPTSNDAATGGAAPDVSLRWSLTDDHVACQLTGSADLFTHARIERLAEQLTTLLAALVAHPDQPIATASALSSDEQALLTSWQGQRVQRVDRRGLAERVADVAQRSPELAAIRSGDETWTFAELDRWADRLAADLRSSGVGPGHTVAVTTDRSPELIGTILAVLRAGAAYVPIDPSYPEARRRYMLEHSRAAVAVSGGAIVSLRPAGGDAVTHSDADLGYVIYTSGSTGTPKAVAMPQRALGNLIDWQLDQNFAPGLVTLQFASASFDVSFQEIFSTLLSGGTLVMIDEAARRDQRALLRHIIVNGVERVFLPNVALRGLVDAATRESASDGLRLAEVYTAGEQLRIDDAVRAFFAQLPDCRLVNQYGPSETHVATAHVLAASSTGWPALPPIGRPIANAVAEVLDGHGQRCAIGVPGELWLGGLCVAAGYLDDDEATSERFHDDPFRPNEVLYRSGDRARWTDAGELEYLGRLDEQVKFRGMRIEPAEIAIVLADNPSVAACHVTVKESPAAGQRLVAYVQLTDPSESFAALRSHVARRLPDYMVPTHFVELPALPLTPSGKVDTRALPMPDFDRRTLSTEFAAPTTSVETAVLEMWQALLDTNDIGIDDDFFDAGGDSLMAVELFTMLHDRFGVELPLGTLAQNPTVRWIASETERAATGVDVFTTVVPIRVGGDRRPLFCVHGGSGDVASFPRLARQLDVDQPLYGVQWPGLVSGRVPRALPDLAGDYLDEIRSIQPTGPYRLAGQCVGGLLAHEMSRQLLEVGERVELLVMYDSPMLYSPAYRPAASAPAIPAPIRPIALPALSRLVSLVRFAKGSESRLQNLRVRVRNVMRRRVAAGDRFVKAASLLAAMSWRHDPADVDVPTVLIHSGTSSAASMAFTGVWTDGALGWEHRLSPSFEARRVGGGHNDLLYGSHAVQIVRDRLASLDRE